MDLEESLGWVGCSLTTVSFLFQFIPFINIIKGKLDYESAPYVFISISYINSFLWMIYGEMIFSFQIKATNFIACLICLISLVIFLSYEIKKETLDSILNFLILFSASWATYKFLAIEVDDERLVGKLCICSSIILYLYFANNIYKVLKLKNFLIIEFNYITVYFVNCMIWFSFGIVTKDAYVIFPYMIGLIVSMTQIIIYINFERKYRIVPKTLGSSIGIEDVEKEENKNNEKEEQANEITFNEEIKIKSKEKPVKIISKINN